MSKRTMCTTLRACLIVMGSMLASACPQPQDGDASIEVDVEETLHRLLAEEDTDGDKKITVEDRGTGTEGAGDGDFIVTDYNERATVISGTYHLANLLQELILAQRRGAKTATLHLARITEKPTHRISRVIRERFWHGLTREINLESLPSLVRDEKIPSQKRHYLYVPPTDPETYAYFARALDEAPVDGVAVRLLPEDVTPQFVQALNDGRHGMLMLAGRITGNGDWKGLPFVVPGGRFNEMYGWDSYFQLLGLLADDKVGLARAAVDHMVYQIVNYGRILNANRTYYLTRSQPPFLSSMTLAVYERLPKNDASRAWLRRALTAVVTEYENVWTGANRLNPETGLSRYHGVGLGIPPEVEQGHYDEAFARMARGTGFTGPALERAYIAGSLPLGVTHDLDSFFRHDRCMRESGHDTTFRWQRNGDRCADFVTVDLNSLLFRIEMDLATTLDREFGGRLQLNGLAETTSETWYTRARTRRAAIREFLWDAEHSVFFDYDTRTGSRHQYISATAFYPLWASSPDYPNAYRLVSNEEAARLVRALLTDLEANGGIAATAEASRGPISPLRPARQWDFPFGWAPHQMLAWQGLLNFGLEETAERLIYRWLYTITRNAVDYNGTIPEKFDVLHRSHNVFAEYGNVGTDFEYITEEGFGWMNASYQVGLQQLDPALRAKLDALTPPEAIWRP